MSLAINQAVNAIPQTNRPIKNQVDAAFRLILAGDLPQQSLYCLPLPHEHIASGFINYFLKGRGQVLVEHSPHSDNSQGLYSESRLELYQGFFLKIASFMQLIPGSNGGVLEAIALFDQPAEALRSRIPVLYRNLK